METIERISSPAHRAVILFLTKLNLSPSQIVFKASAERFYFVIFEADFYYNEIAMDTHQERLLSFFEKFQSGKEAMASWLNELDFDLLKAQSEYILSDLDDQDMSDVYKKSVRLYLSFLAFFTPATTPDDIEKLFRDRRINYKALMASSDIARDPTNEGEAISESLGEYYSADKYEEIAMPDEEEFFGDEDNQEEDDYYEVVSSPIQSVLQPLDDFRAYAILHYNVPFEEIWNAGRTSMDRMTAELVVLDTEKIIQVPER